MQKGKSKIIKIAYACRLRFNAYLSELPSYLKTIIMGKLLLIMYKSNLL